jgi:hypothetical protein
MCRLRWGLRPRCEKGGCVQEKIPMTSACAVYELYYLFHVSGIQDTQLQYLFGYVRSSA